jgi:hypothetical protein
MSGGVHVFLLYRTRRIADKFDEEYLVDPEQAVANLKKRLEGEINKVQYMVIDTIRSRYPGVEDDLG